MKGIVALANHDPASADVSIIAKALISAPAFQQTAREFAKDTRAPDRVIRILEKASVGGLTTSNSEALVDWQYSAKAFFASLRSQSVFMRLLEEGVRKAPFRSLVGMVSTSATAYLRQEGAPYGVSKVTLGEGSKLNPTSVGTILVVTDELARNMTTEASSLLNAELRNAVSYVVDDEFFSLIVDASTPSTPSAGTGIAGMKADLKTLLDAVNKLGVGPLVWAMSPDVANDASILDEREEMTPLGGFLLGLPAMVSSVVPAGTLRLINGAAIVANAEGMEMDASQSATIQMMDNPTNNSATPTPTELVSMFQTNSTALLAKVIIGAHRMRDDAVAEVTGIQWGVA